MEERRRVPRPKWLTRQKKPRPDIPQTPDDLTAEWFTAILTADATHGSVVTAVRCDTIGTDIGFIGEVHRCHLTWSGNGGTDAPRPGSVIVKVPTQNDANFALGDGMAMYEREIVIYRTLRDSLGITTPRFLYAAMDPDPAPWLERPVLWLFDHLPLGALNWLIRQFLKLAGKSKRRYILVLEDIVNARPPTQIEGGSLDDTHAALRVLAAFHARNWMRTEALDEYGRFWPVDRGSRVYQAGYSRNRQAFIDRFGGRVGADTLARLDDIQTRVPELNKALAAEPWSLLHGDFRLDNLLFRPDGEIVVLDLQGVGYGRPAVDVAYLITTALAGEHRAEEEQLLRTYHDALVAEGVSCYSWDELVHDCALTKEMLAHRIVGAADIIRTETTNGDALLDVLQLRVLDWLD